MTSPDYYKLAGIHLYLRPETSLVNRKGGTGSLYLTISDFIGCFVKSNVLHYHVTEWGPVLTTMSESFDTSIPYHNNRTLMV